MKYSFCLFLILLFGCAREVKPTVENINKIFESKDFTFKFYDEEGSCKSLSFRHDYLVYKSDAPTVRRTITYDEVLRINNFIQQIVNQHDNSLKSKRTDYYIIENTAYVAAIFPKNQEQSFSSLLTELGL